MGASSPRPNANHRAVDLGNLEPLPCSAEPALFTPVTRLDYKRAVHRCFRCPLIDTCLEGGQTNGSSGVYGGQYLRKGRIVERGFVPAKVGRPKNSAAKATDEVQSLAADGSSTA